MIFNKYHEDDNLDVVKAIKCYLSRTEKWRETTAQKGQFFLATISPHEPVVTCTIARWLKLLMAEAGIKIEQYKAHSIRAASTSKVHRQGLSVEQIVKMGKWTNANTFHKFYHKEIVTDSAVSDAVLRL